MRYGESVLSIIVGCLYLMYSIFFASICAHDAHRNACTVIYCDCYFCTIFTETRVCRKVCKIPWNSVEL